MPFGFKKNALLFFLIFVMLISVDVSGCVYYKRNVFLRTPHIAALILARGGSKGIKLKNLQSVGGQTLLERSIFQVVQAKFDSIWVSTDHILIAEEANKLNVNVHWREPETATDKASSLFAVQEFLGKHPVIDSLALIQCTSPFLKAAYLNQAKSLVYQFGCVFSVSRSYKLLWNGSSGKLFPVNFDPRNRPRRQDLEEQFSENGMFYFANRELIARGHFQTTGCGIVEIPPYADMEIDTYTDLAIANMLAQLEL